MENIEVFYSDIKNHSPETHFWNEDKNMPLESGWFYWHCMPGCLPDSQPFGPFPTEKEASIEANKIYEQGLFD